VFRISHHLKPVLCSCSLLSPSSFGDGVQVNGHELEVVVISSQVFLGVVLFWNTRLMNIFAGGAFHSLVGMTGGLLPCRRILLSHLLLSPFCGSASHHITLRLVSGISYHESVPFQICDCAGRFVRQQRPQTTSIFLIVTAVRHGCSLLSNPSNFDLLRESYP
jgi:hypothetical protein